MKVTVRRTSGISLIETLVVVALVALAAAFVGPSIGAGLENMTLRSTGRQIVSVLRRTQADARMRQESLAVRVEDGEAVLIGAGSSRRTALDASIRIGDGAPVTYLLLGSGQIVGPERLELENRRGRRGVVELGPAPGAIRFVEEAP